MRKGNRLLLILTGILGLCAVVLLLLVSVFRVESLTIIEQNTELIYQSSSAEMMGFEFSYLSAQDEPKTVATMRFVARDFPVYVIGRTTQSFGPFEVTTVQAVIAPMDTEWPESGGLDLSDAILTFTDGSEEQIRLGKLKLGFYPTPFHRLDRISEEYGVELYVKREDFSGMTLFGGNKIRKLEYLLHDAIRQGCDTVVTYGATQSNHAMETATAARKCGLNPVLFLAAIVEPNAADIRANLLLDTILGAEINIIPANGQSTKQTMEESQDLIQGRIKELEAQGENAKTIWSETHLTRDGGGAWVREINDRGAKLYPNGNARGEKGSRLADYLEHPELYEAEPGIADINVELGTLSESEKGKYSPQERTLRFTEDTFKNKSMSDIMHEVQHAIQNEEELAAGGSRKLAYAALVSDAYEAVKDMRKNYDVHIEYDMSAHIPRNVKYCFIAIVKEGMSNIIKHSNADKVDIIFREHPGFYQLCIEDNGSVSHSVEESDHGIGISNMRERVEALGGTLNIRQKNGFRIFATVRKEMEETE